MKFIKTIFTIIILLCFVVSSHTKKTGEYDKKSFLKEKSTNEVHEKNESKAQAQNTEKTVSKIHAASQAQENNFLQMEMEKTNYEINKANALAELIF